MDFNKLESKIIRRSSNTIISMISDIPLEYNIKNKIIKKQYEKNLGGRSYFSSIEEEFLNEVNFLYVLQKYGFVPTIYFIDYDNQIIYMSYSGEVINDSNIPDNWKEQLISSLSILNKLNIYHNDLYLENILVNNDKIYFIDFTYCDYDEQYPFINIDLNVLPNLDVKLLYSYLLNDIYNKRRLDYINLYAAEVRSYKEHLSICNYHRQPELFSIIIWDGLLDKDKTENYLLNLPLNFTIIKKQLLQLSKETQLSLMKSLYFTEEEKNNRIINSTIYLIVLKDYTPIYQNIKATSCIQVLNKNMYTIKKELRKLLGNSENAFNKVHTSYNVEETLLALRPLGYNNLLPRKHFLNLKHFFDTLNTYDKLQYVVQRSWDDLVTLDNFKKGEDIDILTNDYYFFKNITTARSNNSHYMRENDDGFYIQSNVMIQNQLVNIDIRYVGDNYLNEKWEYNILKNRKMYQINDITCYIPKDEDILYSLIYNILIQKHKNPSIKKHYPTISKLLKREKLQEFQSIENYILQKEGALTDLRNFLIREQYTHLLKPKDIHVGFYTEKIIDLEVPNKVDYESGPNWGTIKEK